MAFNLINTAPSGNPLTPRQRLWADQFYIWFGIAGLALVAWASGLESWLAQLLYQPDISTGMGGTAWWLRQWGAAIPGYLAVAALGVVVWPKLSALRPLLYQSCAVLVIAAALGAGLINQVVLQELTDRHRPRETILVGQHPANLPAELQGNSFPSGHAGIAFALAAPFFALRRRRPQLAKTVLVGGLVFGGLVGFGRMVLGAHYLSDILIAAAISLSVAAVAAHLLLQGRTIPRRWLAVGVLVALLGMLLGNSFKLNLVLELTEPLPRIELPCVVNVVPQTGLINPTLAPTLVVNLRGYGAPVSGLQLQNKNNIVRLVKGVGVFHSLRCTAELKLPQATE